MAAAFATEAEPFMSPVESLGPISEDNHIRAPSASPDPYIERTEYFGHQTQQNPPNRSSTYPLATSGSPDEHIRKPLGRSTTAYQPSEKHRNTPPAVKRTSRSEPYLPSQEQRRQATVDSKNSASFADTAVWDQKAILSLDGGGIRGYSALLILQELMKAIGRIESAYNDGPSEADGPAKSSYHPLAPSPYTATGSRPLDCQDETINPRTESSPWLPCHYFDYVAGTSTGGLIGIMLGRLRMNIDDCITEYESLGSKVFGHSRVFHIRSPLWWPRDKYNHKNLENAVRDVVKRRVPKVPEFPGGRSFAFDENRCRTVVVAFQQRLQQGPRQPAVEKPYLFRTYKNLHKSKGPGEECLDRNPDMAHDISIWQVARATSAAPTYFKPMVIDGLEYIDGGFGANNPCMEIFDEVRRMNNHSNACTKIILSIGTGISNKESRFNGTGLARFINYWNFARKWATDSQVTHDQMIRARSVFGFTYFRFNVEEGLGQMKLDEWHARGPMRIKIGNLIGKLRSPKVDEGNTANGAEAGNHKSEHFMSRTAANAMAANDNGTEVAGLPTATGPDTDAGEQTDVSSTAEEKVEGMVNPLGHKNGRLRATLPSRHSQSPNTKARYSSSAIPQWFRPKNETLDAMRAHTREYLSKDETRQTIEECARLLVDGRRGRAKKDPQRWEKACFGAWYQCIISECPRGEKEYETRRELRKHLLDKHRESFTRDQEGRAKLDQALDSCKIIVH